LDGKWQKCDAPPPPPPRLKATVRDFLDTHPDFEHFLGSAVDDIVETTLGPDDKPVYAGKPTTPTTTGKANFDEWYRDVPGVNVSTTIRLPLTPSPAKPATLVFDDNTFFPIDDQLFGNQGRPHNYHFTLELATKFRYEGGETLGFTGDDDLWVFINRRLAINLGGLHPPLSAIVDLDLKSQDLGLVKGETYPLHLFFAERHTTASSLHVETNVAEWDGCD
jgi:fibro-slime domain-containing protein